MKRENKFMYTQKLFIYGGIKMNKYQIQIHHKTESKRDYMTIYANFDSEAIQSARIKLFNYQNPVILPSDDFEDKYRKGMLKEQYTGFEISSILSIERDCGFNDNYDTISSSNTEESNQRAFFNVNWNDYTEIIAKTAAPEVWSNDTYPNNGILANYMINTYKKLQSERNVIFSEDYALFNTGLFTKYYEPIYAYHSGQNISFITEYELGNIGIDKYPERANYFDDPSLLLFDWHYKINIHYKHILDDINNLKRLPQNMQDNKNILNNLNGSIDTMKKRVSANYKLAIPQYFDGKIQLLLPLCLQSDNVPDLALVVTKVGNVYQGHTCLTLDMAYNNARLIAKPESNWLKL